MRIDDENKVVVPDFVAEWFESISDPVLDGNDVFRIIQDVLKVAGGLNTWNDYDVDAKLVDWVESNEETFLKLIVNCNKGVGYTAEPTKYYWRKKKESLASFEDVNDNYLSLYQKNELKQCTIMKKDIAENNDLFRSSLFTEAEARDLLKDDFDKFEKVVCE